MTNIIRPTFGSRLREAPPSAPQGPGPDGYRPLYVYGKAAGYLVALLEDEAGPEGSVLKILVGPEESNLVETVGVLPNTPGGRADADMAAMVVLRTLEVVEDARPPAIA